LSNLHRLQNRRVLSIIRFTTILIKCIDSVILGRAIKTEYLMSGTLFVTGCAVFASLAGRKDSASSGKPLAERVKEAVPLNPGFRCVDSCSH
ncbi:hypothetical protein DFH29DRAFT_944273, partial [Suillus ampliporus]